MEVLTLSSDSESEPDVEQSTSVRTRVGRRGEIAAGMGSNTKQSEQETPKTRLSTIPEFKTPKLKLVDSTSVFDRPSFQVSVEGETRASITERLKSIPPDEPLPKQKFTWHISNLGSSATALSREQILRDYGDSPADRAQFEAFVFEKEDESKRTPGEPSAWSWEQVSYAVPDQLQEGAVDFCRTEFFPWADQPGLASFEHSFAVAGSATVKLFQPSQDQEGKEAQVVFHGEFNLECAGTAGEDLRACSWALDTKRYPPTPLIVAAGTGRLVHVIQVYRGSADDPKKLTLVLERSISGSGQTVWDLATLPTRPNVVVVAGEDEAPILFDVTVKGGANAEQQVNKMIAVEEWNEELEAQGLPSIVLECVHRDRVQGEMIGKFEGRGAGHDKGVLSCAVHPVLPFLVTGGLDGRVCVWKLPDVEKLSRVTSAVDFDEPIFRSSRVHSGQWVDQVAWASPTSTAIISKSAYSHVESAKSKSKMMLLWIPQALDDVDEDDEWTAEQLGLPEDSSNVPSLDDNNAFHVERRAEWEDHNVIGDRFGVYHADCDRDNFDEPFVAVPVGPRPILSGGTTSPAISIQHPFSSRRFPCADGSSNEEASELACVDALFPADRDRSINEFTTRWRPEDWITLDEGDTRGEEEQAPRFRAVAVSLDGMWMVAVGEGEAMGVWRRVMKDETAAECAERCAIAGLDRELNCAR